MFPGIHLVSEELDASWPPDQDEFVILDPLDGTHNFLMGIPLFGTMFAFIAHGVIEWSTIFLPMEELCGNNGFYFAARRNGAWKYQGNEAIKLQVSSQRVLDRAQVLLEGKSKNVFKSSLAQSIQRNVLRTRNNISMCWSITRVASGGLFPNGIDAMVSFDNKPSDNLPGVLFIEEAGGKVSDFSGDTVSLTRCKSLVFSNGLLHPSLIALGKEVFSG
jgi:fructose-1,6-bisphosphatase/inositol monophosphatase family enzyme